MHKMVIVVRKDLNMRKGKIAAQVGHAVQYYMEDENKNPYEYEYWKNSGSTKIVVGCSNLDELMEIYRTAKDSLIPAYIVVDFGLTEFNNKRTITCVAIGPGISYHVDNITSELSLL